VRTVTTFTGSALCTVGDGVAGVDRALEGVGPSTLVASLICATSSLAATRGAMFLPQAVAGNRMWL